MVKYSSKSILWSYSNAVRSNLVSVHHQECDNLKRWGKKIGRRTKHCDSEYDWYTNNPCMIQLNLKKKLSFFLTLHVSMST